MLCEIWILRNWNCVLGHFGPIWQQTSDSQQIAKHKHVGQYEWRIKNSTLGFEDRNIFWKFSIALADAAIKINKKLDQKYPGVREWRCDR